MTCSEFSKRSGNRVVCISFAPGEKESFGNSRRAPAIHAVVIASGNEYRLSAKKRRE
ncbi:hypothetical protein ALC62_05131 [Cyphomyrmex costatus]|uniref:Uncharacterized protein n=1 Tax=Cyphomyrmex costatus TaxID=456900 RepID=A0A195CUN0_9HYME|nr:hypothetical protein ALC62_05131 [Cyphomyrmex costatus]